MENEYYLQYAPFLVQYNIDKGGLVGQIVMCEARIIHQHLLFLHFCFCILVFLFYLLQTRRMIVLIWVIEMLICYRGDHTVVQICISIPFQSVNRRQSNWHILQYQIYKYRRKENRFGQNVSEPRIWQRVVVGAQPDRRWEDWTSGGGREHLVGGRCWHIL